jgi:uncharacterized repeat protein (TIGR02543 family)
MPAAGANYGSLLQQPPSPTRTGYRFLDWYREPECATRWNFSIDTMPAGNLTLYAGWAINRYTVTFDSQGGSTVASAEVTHGAVLAEPAAPVRPGWYFTGWYEEPEYSNNWNFTADTVTGNIMLYARWAAQARSAALSGIVLSAGSLSPSFSPSRKSYTVYLDENTGSITITPAKAYAGASLTINGKKVSSKTVSVACGKSTSLTVKVALGRMSTTVKLTVKRAKSTNNLLSSLKASTGTLSPAFDPTVTAYTLTLPAGTARVKLTATKTSRLASLTNGIKTYSLKPGKPVTATIKVKAQSGAVKIYKIHITRAVQ